MVFGRISSSSYINLLDVNLIKLINMSQIKQTTPSLEAKTNTNNPPRVFLTAESLLKTLRYVVEVDGKNVFKNTDYKECIKIAKQYNADFIDLSNFY